MNPTINFSPYLLSSVFNPRYHQHLSHLNDMAFTHTKILQEILEKHPIESSSASSTTSSVSPMAATSNDLIQQQKRSHSYIDNNNNEDDEQQQKECLTKRSKIHDENEDNKQLNKRSRKQLQPQQMLNETNPSNDNDDDENDGDDDDDDEKSLLSLSSEKEIGEIKHFNENQNVNSSFQSATFPLPSSHIPFLNYIQELARANNITSPIAIARFVENLQKELFSTVYSSAIDTKRILSPATSTGFSQTIQHQSHPYFPQILFNGSFINQYPSTCLTSSGTMISSASSSSDRPFSFHLSAPKKRRTKVTDTRLSPRVASKIVSHEDLIDDDKSSSDHSCESTTSNNQQQQQSTIVYNNYQIILTSLHLRKAKLMFFYTRYPTSAVLKVYFADVRFNKLITAQLVKWFSNFREFFYIQIEKYARQYIVEGVRNVENLIITTDSDLYRVLNLHYNRSNQIEVPNSFCNVVQSTLREFFLAIRQQKDLEPSWKKSIYKIIQRLDDQIPEYFKDEHWMHSI